jgi:hypothetical protein
VEKENVARCKKTASVALYEQVEEFGDGETGAIYAVEQMQLPSGGDAASPFWRRFVMYRDRIQDICGIDQVSQMLNKVQILTSLGVGSLKRPQAACLPETILELYFGLMERRRSAFFVDIFRQGHG